MSTRADFYIGRGKNAEWIGSIAFDGYPSGIPKTILNASTEKEYVEAVESFIKSRPDGTLPEQGWPWPWTDSSKTRYAYAFDDGRVLASYYGSAWFDPKYMPKDPNVFAIHVVEFPDMSEIQNVTFGKRSGVSVYGPKPEEE